MATVNTESTAIAPTDGLRSGVVQAVRRVRDRDGGGRKEYQVQIEVIESRELKGRSKGANSDPMVVVELGGERQHTTIFKSRTSCVWNQSFFFTLTLTDAEFQNNKLTFHVMDSCRFGRDKLIGRYDLDIAKVHGRPQHELHRKWLGLTAAPQHAGLQGFLKVSCIVLGPGDPQPAHDKEGDDEEEITSDNLQDMVLMPPDVQLTAYHLNFQVYRAEGLPKVDTFGSIDPFVVLKFAAAIAQTEHKVKDQSPQFNMQLTLPVYVPTLSDQVELQLFDYDVVGANRMISMLLFNFTDIALKGPMAPRWYPMYRPKNRTLREAVKAISRRDIEVQSNYAGSILVGCSTELVLEGQQARVNKQLVSPCPLPQTMSYTLRFDLYLGAEFPATKAENVTVILRFGKEKRSLRKGVQSNGFVQFYQQFEDVVTTLPTERDSWPYIFVEVNAASKLFALGKGRLGYLRYRADDPVVFGFDKHAKWTPLTRDPVSPITGDEDIPGFLLFKIEFGLTAQAPPPKPRPKAALPLPNTRKYQLRAHIYQGRALPAADRTGTSDPYCIIRMGHVRVKSSIKKETLYPQWYETIMMEVELPEQMSLAPNVSVLVYDDNEVQKNVFLGRFEVPATQIRSRWPGDPKWYDCYVESPDSPEGSILASFQLIPLDRAAAVPKPNLHPQTKDCVFEISVVGLRKLMGVFGGLRDPVIEFDCGDRSDKRKIVRTKTSSLPSAVSPNYLEVMEIPMALPLNRLYAPALNVQVHSGIFRVASASIDLTPFIPWVNLMVSEDDEPEAIDDNVSVHSENSAGKTMIDIPADIVDCNEERAAPIEFSIKPARKGFEAGDRTMPEVREQALGPQSTTDATVPDEGFDCELETKLSDIPFMNIDLYRGNSRGRGLFDNLFKKKHDPGRQTAGTFKGRFRVLESDKLASYGPKLNLPALYTAKSYIVRVYVIRGRQLMPKDYGGTSDPYIQIQLGDQTIDDTNGKQQKTVNPNWYKMYELKTSLPGNSELRINVMDWNFLLKNELIGTTIIDLEDRVFSEQWKRMGSLSPKPKEWRTLWSPLASTSQGQIEMWVEILTVDEAARTPPFPITPPRPEKYELRVVLWETKDCALKYNTPKLNALGIDARCCLCCRDPAMSDIFVSANLEGPGEEAQKTDIHYRSKDGTGKFYWRMVFPLSLPAEIPRLTIQVWDNSYLKPNDAIAEAVLNLKGFFNKGLREKKRITIDEGTIAMTHPNFKGVQGKCKLTLQLLPESEAAASPVGLGRDDPNTDPELLEPDRPGTLRAFFPPNVTVLVRWLMFM
eukprot:TRINITY_DN2257_c0_g1_i2.p1 TRINITY_DN2257_c0_g1~~TRINITY_DN2257_c0_g1_i2.p1  ORF type:complete len:1294 (-),score=282.18 TRINITY_DN2257_c0_g1_i2:252-4133(-)